MRCEQRGPDRTVGVQCFRPLGEIDNGIIFFDDGANLDFGEDHRLKLQATYLNRWLVTTRQLAAAKLRDDPRRTLEGMTAILHRVSPLSLDLDHTAPISRGVPSTGPRALDRR